MGKIDRTALNVRVDDDGIQWREVAPELMQVRLLILLAWAERELAKLSRHTEMTEVERG